MSAWLGVGFGLRAPHLQALIEQSQRAQRAPKPAVLELTPSHFVARPERLDPLIGRHVFVLHDVLASLATAGPLDLAYLDRVAALAERVGARAYSEHLAMTRSPGGLDLGHLVPVPRTPALLDELATKLETVSSRLALPISLELPTSTLALPPTPASMSEAAFIRALIDRSGCGLHLDLDNLWHDARNAVDMGLELDLDLDLARPALREDLDASLRARGVAPAYADHLAWRLAALPLGAVTRVHLAGGHVDAEGWAVDSHSGPSSPASLTLLAALASRIRPRAVIVERDAELPPLAELLDEVAEIEGLLQW